MALHMAFFHCHLFHYLSLTNALLWKQHFSLDTILTPWYLHFSSSSLQLVSGDWLPPPVLSVVVVDPAELDGAVQRLGLLAGEGVGRVVAGEGLLVEDGLVAADEGPLRVVDDVAAGVLERQADVEDLAVVGDVGVVAVGPRLAGEGLLHGRGEDVLGGVGELVAAGVLLREAQLQEGQAFSMSLNLQFDLHQHSLPHPQGFETNFQFCLDEKYSGWN